MGDRWHPPRREQDVNKTFVTDMVPRACLCAIIACALERREGPQALRRRILAAFDWPNLPRDIQLDDAPRSCRGSSPTADMGWQRDRAVRAAGQCLRHLRPAAIAL